MAVETGDRIVVRGQGPDQPDRYAEIIEVARRDGRPPYRVRWSDSGRVANLVVGIDDQVLHTDHARG